MLELNGFTVDYTHFPDGTLKLEQDTHLPKYLNEIAWYFENNEELLALYFLVKHLQDSGQENLSLLMPYLPNARQDRREQDSDVLTLKHFAGIINSLHFRQVRVLDPHSSQAWMINNLHPIPYADKIFELLEQLGFDAAKDSVFYPDEGAMKRYSDQLLFPYLFGIKNRNWVTGQITSYELQGRIKEGARVLIVDDICSYGTTFLHAARTLKKAGAGDIYLYVNHLENNVLDGELIKSGLLRHIYTTDSIYTASHPLINVFWEVY